jgi:hypothetical protein
MDEPKVGCALCLIALEVLGRIRENGKPMPNGDIDVQLSAVMREMHKLTHMVIGG